MKDFSRYGKRSFVGFQEADSCVASGSVFEHEYEFGQQFASLLESQFVSNPFHVFPSL